MNAGGLPCALATRASPARQHAVGAAPSPHSPPRPGRVHHRVLARSPPRLRLRSPLCPRLHSLASPAIITTRPPHTTAPSPALTTAPSHSPSPRLRPPFSSLTITGRNTGHPQCACRWRHRPQCHHPPRVRGVGITRVVVFLDQQQRQLFLPPEPTVAPPEIIPHPL
jgi:hypothetical protein